MLMISYTAYDMPHGPMDHELLLILLRCYESFYVLRNDGNVISKSSRKHEVIDKVTQTV